MTDYQHKITLDAFIERESVLTDIVLMKEVYTPSIVIVFMSKAATPIAARWDVERFCFVELSIITDLGIEYIKLV